MIIVQCIEPDALPLFATLEVQLLQRFRVYVLSDVRHSSGSSLRSTIVLPIDEDPPPEALLMLELDVYDPGAGDPPLFRTRRMGSRCFVDMVRPNVRSRLTEGGEIPSGSRLEAILQDTRRVTITLQMETDLMRNTNAIGGGSMKHRTSQDVSSGWFLYNSLAQLLTLNWVLVKAWLEKWARRIGIHPWVIVVLMSILAVIGLALYAAYNRNKAAQAAEDQVASLEESQENLETARASALENEMACLAERQALAARLKDIDEQKKLLVSQALNYSFTQSVAVETGGGRMMADPVLPFDEQYKATVEKSVMAAMDTVKTDPGEMSFCLEQASILGLDLPRYILTWHPDLELVCPLQYSTIDAGINRMGSWGLSSRVAKEFGAQNLSEGGEEGLEQLTEQLGDPRMAPRWSAKTLAIGLREVQFTLLTSDTGPRPPVSPSQMHVWSLALWDAYNRLPSPASGVMDKPVGYCVDELMNALVSSPEPSVPGAPVLPDLALVASGEKRLDVTPSPSCPWPADVFTRSALATIQSVANLAHYIDFEAQQPQDDG